MLRSSRPPNAPPTPPSTSRTFSGGRSSEAASWSWSTCSHWVAMKRSTPPSSAGTASPDSGPRNAWSCMPTSYSPRRPRRRPVGVRVAVADRDVAEQVAARVQRRRGGVERRLGVGERLEHLVVDLDLPGRRARGLGVVGGDERDRLALVADVLPGEHGLVLDLQAVGLAAGDVLVGEHRVHARDAQRGADLDAADPRARVRAAQRRAPQHAVGPHVGGVGELALDLGDAVGRGATAGRRRRRGVSVTVLTRPPRRGSPAGATGAELAGDRLLVGRAQLAAARRPRARRRAACRPAGAARARARRPGRRSRRGRRRRAATARCRRPCRARASRSRSRGRGSGRRGSCPSSSAWRAVSACGPPRQPRDEQRLAQLAAQLARLVGGRAVDAQPDRRAGADQRRDGRDAGAEPRVRARAVGDAGAASRRSAAPRASSRWTQWASQTSSPSQPSCSRYSTGRQPNSSRQKRSSSSVSAMWVCRRTPRSRASSADSRISSLVTLNGEQGASAIRTIASGAGSW